MLETLDISADPTRQENVTRILDCAERLFRHYGYGKTNVADIARELGMSTANIYRFFGSKVEIHQAVCGRMLATCYRLTYEACHSPGTASEKLRRYVQTHYQWTRDTMLDQEKVHEMVIVAIERDWHVIEKHIDSIQDLVAEVIREGIATGEFADRDPVAASRCFGAAIISLCHPQMVAQCAAKNNRAMPDELIEFVIGALKK
ncbi:MULTISPECIES: TetR family transcriptional regulator [unclassified Mesorhizobium]|uniref:TetR family transcriptional regulator n=1 Tax=unclassified Mesorhizobium TaxID=325217 RepID=UPI000FDA1DF1|nr:MULTISPECIES: TetR family transcriptional regulator [unclassified Mesorhizobium]TGQ38470.1 TetR/AcrR family transcriptional regulator [Mesorhizobium sp. M00.F.Ca.ET.216.01.1.1]TIS54154.1 MAG: TetR/AcrR family transcriptional regulator [Mesorhizobium sp.]TIS86684.1 MAG: TetR/AcrR family transcriptional regulator [Mesorhizobium sp.]TJW05639.1 MAG: TetR/AcrR family transcriptional regulator [Mesorhizobium sp.]TJW44594.1 MAG: TetR/AcrR family transcriptional regulator [Mesorhizobium sp.]